MTAAAGGKAPRDLSAPPGHGEAVPCPWTPGPWTVEDRDERLLIWADGSHQEIADLSTVAEGADEDAQEKYAEEQRANAALIASAPALAAEVGRLREALERCECVLVTLFYAGALVGGTVDALYGARAALGAGERGSK